MKRKLRSVDTTIIEKRVNMGLKVWGKIKSFAGCSMRYDIIKIS